MSAVDGLCMTGTIRAKRSSVRHQAQQEGLKQTTLMGKTQCLKNTRQSACYITSTWNGHRATLKNWLTTRGLMLETSEGATSEGAMMPCTSRVGLGPKELAD
eukprot:7092579-Ditylum_brightwellii.AAC.1